MIQSLLLRYGRQRLGQPLAQVGRIRRAPRSADAGFAQYMVSVRQFLRSLTVERKNYLGILREANRVRLARRRAVHRGSPATIIHADVVRRTRAGSVKHSLLHKATVPLEFSFGGRGLVTQKRLTEMGIVPIRYGSLARHAPEKSVGATTEFVAQVKAEIMSELLRLMEESA